MRRSQLASMRRPGCFRRRSGFDTAYVWSSSNLSRSALIEGLEWNVRLSGVSTPALLTQVRGNLRQLLGRSRFRSEYDPDNDADRLDDALARASGQGDRARVSGHRYHARRTRTSVPYPHQRSRVRVPRCRKQPCTTVIGISSSLPPGPGKHDCCRARLNTGGSSNRAART